MLKHISLWLAAHGAAAGRVGMEQDPCCGWRPVLCCSQPVCAPPGCLFMTAVSRLKQFPSVTLCLSRNNLLQDCFRGNLLSLLLSLMLMSLPGVLVWGLLVFAHRVGAITALHWPACGRKWHDLLLVWGWCGSQPKKRSTQPEYIMRVIKFLLCIIIAVLME